MPWQLRKMICQMSFGKYCVKLSSFDRTGHIDRALGDDSPRSYNR